MALREKSPAGPLFNDPSIPFLQLARLYPTLEHEQGHEPDEHTISIYQDDAWFGLRLRNRNRLDEQDWDGIYRLRPLDLVTGHIDAVEVRLERDIIAEVSLTIADRELLLVAGEVYETWTDEFEVHRLDESVLVFTTPADAAQVDWL